MQAYQRELLDLAMRRNVLRFGEFTLKSGRLSPYFFNAGLFNDGESLLALGRAYARAAQDCGTEFDMLFGPAYKGITLAAACAMALALDHGRNLPYAYNRKEAKAHGEAGILVGAPLGGRVLIIDDVITAGTSIRESVAMIRAAGAEPAGVLIALDRQERLDGDLSAAQEVTQRYGIPVHAIAKLDQLFELVAERADLAVHARPLAEYRSRYGLR